MVMAKSGLRVGEVCALRWRSVDTAHQRLVIEQAKTAAGVREVDLSRDLVEELNAWRAEHARQRRRVRVRRRQRSTA